MSDTTRAIGRWTAALAAGALFSAAAPARAQPVATIEGPTVHDVGTVARGTEIIQGFPLLNSGDATLEIDEVKASCGCTVTEYPPTLAAGERSRILLKLDTSSFRGPIAKTATVYTNDPANPRINLVVKAAIQPMIEVQPGYARFVVVQGEPYEVSEQKLWSAGKPDLEIVRVVSPFPHLGVESVQTAGAGEGSSEANEWRLRFELDPGAPQGPLMDYVVVETNHPEQPRVRIPVSGFVRPPVAVTPRVLDLGERTMAEPYPARVELKVLSSDAIRMGDVTVDLDGVEAEVEEVEAGRLYTLIVNFGQGMEKGPIDGTITISTNSRLQPRVEVPLRGTVL